MTKPELISSYTAFVAKRAEIRQRQRGELEAELEPHLLALGRAINEAQASGKRIEDIEYEIGAKNRTLVYRAKRLAKGIKDVPKVETPPEPDKGSEPAWKISGPYSDIGLDGRFWYVYINDEPKGEITKFDYDGEIQTPDAWAADPDNSKIYREIISHIKEL